MKFIQWLMKATIQTTAGNIVLGVLVVIGVGIADAATSYDVTNEPQMNLDVSINGTQVTGIVLAAPQLNATDHTFASTTGAVLRIRWGEYREDIFATGATINAATKKVTLVGVTRNLCPQVARTYTSCGDGRAWGKGAIVELIQDARLFNLKANVDRANTFTASGGILFQGSGSLTFPTFSTTAERDRQMGASGGDFRTACVTGTGLCYLRLGGTWTEIGEAGTANATTTTSGKVEIATVTNISGAVLTDDSGAPLSLSTFTVIRHSSGAVNNRNKIVATNNAGYLSGALLGSGTPSKANVLLGNMQWVSSGSVGLSQNFISGAVLPSLGLNLLDPTGDSIIASTSFQAVDAVNLSGSLAVAANDLLMINLMAESVDGGASQCDIVQFDVSVRDGTGNPESVTGGAGFHQQVCSTALNNMYEATYFWKPSTGGTLYFGLQARTANGNQVVIHGNSGGARLQVVKFPQ